MIHRSSNLHRWRARIGVLALLGVMVISAGCQNDAQRGLVMGAATGALIGQAAGHDSESTAIGAGIGAGVGYILGNESDKAGYRYDPTRDY